MNTPIASPSLPAKPESSRPAAETQATGAPPKARAPESASPPKASESAAAPRATSLRIPPSSSLNVDVLFRVDEQTQARTVIMVNRATKEVVRTIPPEELEKLTPGDLLTLLA